MREELADSVRLDVSSLRFAQSALRVRIGRNGRGGRSGAEGRGKHFGLIASRRVVFDRGETSSKGTSSEEEEADGEDEEGQGGQDGGEDGENDRSVRLQRETLVAAGSQRRKALTSEEPRVHWKKVKTSSGYQAMMSCPSEQD
jgi:hypothetical protein